MQTSKSIDITRLVAWIVLLIAIVEWLPFFLQIVLNLFNLNLRDFPVEEIIFLLAPIISPFVTLFLSIAGWKKPEAVKKVMSILGVGVMLACAVLNWLSYSAYYQLYGIFKPDLSSIGATGGAYGILSYFTPMVKPLLYWTNAFTFLVLVPILFCVGTGGTGRLQFSHELNLGAMIASIYMVFRPGSIVDTPFRIVLVILAGSAAWLLFLINKKPSELDTSRGSTCIIDSSAIPKWSEEGLAILLAISLINPAMSAMGMLNTTWVWAFLAAATAVVEIMIIKNVKLKSKVPGVLVFAGLIAAQVIVIWADIDATLLSVEPWLQGIALFLLGLLFPTCLPLFSRDRDNRYLTNPGRQFIFNLIGVFSFLLPLLIVALLPPISTLAGMLIVAIGGGLSLLAIWVAEKKSIKAEKKNK